MEIPAHMASCCWTGRYSWLFSLVTTERENPLETLDVKNKFKSYIVLRRQQPPHVPSAAYQLGGTMGGLDHAASRSGITGGSDELQQKNSY